MLNQQIRDVIKQLRDTLPAELNNLLEQGAGEISALDIVECAKKEGDIFPSFSLNDQQGLNKNLIDYLKKGPLIVTFYRGVWCPYCNLQLKAYGERLDELQKTGATLIAITPEKPNSIELFQKSNAPEDVINMAVKEVSFDVLFDEDSKFSEKVGLTFELPEAHQSLLQTMGIDLEKVTGNSVFTFPDPATYIIDTSGKIHWAFVPNNYRKRAEVDQILKALQTIK